MPHQSGDDVDGGSGFKQFGCYAMSEAMNPNMDTLLGLDAELCDRTVYAVLDHIVRGIWPAPRVQEEVAIWVWPKVLLDPIAKVLLEKRGHMERGSALGGQSKKFFANGPA